MNTASDQAAPGGFLSATLPSPPPSSHASTLPGRNILPTTRSSPLKPGSTKESTFIDYVDNKLLRISRRYEKRFNADLGDEDPDKGDIEGRGYKSFGEMVKDLEAVIDVVWTSGSPSLQIPYLLNIALTVCTSLLPFDFAPRPTFRLLNKLDLVLSSLLRGTNAETGEDLSGIRFGRGKPSTTEKVRMRGLVEKTRVAVVEVAGKGMGSLTEWSSTGQTDNDNMTTDDSDDDDNDMNKNMEIDGNHGRWEMEIARVYENTIVELGMTLDISTSGDQVVQ